MASHYQRAVQATEDLRFFLNATEGLLLLGAV